MRRISGDRIISLLMLAPSVIAIAVSSMDLSALPAIHPLHNGILSLPTLPSSGGAIMNGSLVPFPPTGSSWICGTQ